MQAVGSLHWLLWRLARPIWQSPVNLVDQGIANYGNLGATFLVLLAAICISVGTAMGKRYPLSRAASKTRRGRLEHGYRPWLSGVRLPCSSKAEHVKRKNWQRRPLPIFKIQETLEAAKDVVDRLKKKWTEETGLMVNPPSSIGEAMMQAEIRSHLAAMKGSKVDFLATNAIDPRVAGAILGAPPFLSGLTDTEVGVVKSRIERYVATGSREGTRSHAKGSTRS